MREKPLGRMTLRRNAPGDGQKPRIRLWTLPDPPENSTAAKLLKHYERVFTNVDALDAKKAELKANEALTEIGKQRAALDFGFSSIMPDVLRARRAISKASQEAATKRSKLQQPQVRPQRPCRGASQAGNPGHHARAGRQGPRLIPYARMDC